MSVQGFFFRSILWAAQGARNWAATEATVYTYRWNYSSDAESPNHHSDLTYYFRVNGELYSGEAQWSDYNGTYTLHTGDEVQIRYDPGDPSRSYFPEKQNVMKAMYVVVGLLSIICVVALIFVGARHNP